MTPNEIEKAILAIPGVRSVRLKRYEGGVQGYRWPVHVFMGGAMSVRTDSGAVVHIPPRPDCCVCGKPKEDRDHDFQGAAIMGAPRTTFEVVVEEGP